MLRRVWPLFWIMVSGCTSLPDDSYKLYPGFTRTPEKLAVVRLGNQYRVRIDGLSASRADWAEVHLLPGYHTIEWESEFLVSVLVNPKGRDLRRTIETPYLEAGHVYLLKADRTVGNGYQMYQWLEDLTTGELVAGVDKP